MKKIVGIALSVCIAASALQVSAKEPVKLKLNDTYVEFSGAAPEIAYDKTFAPAKEFFEAMGFDVTILSSPYAAIAVKNDLKLIMVSGHWSLYKFNKDGAFRYYFDERPFVRDGVLFVPVRGICNAIGAEISWDNDNFTAVMGCGENFIAEKNENTEFTPIAGSLLSSLEGGEKFDYDKYCADIFKALGITVDLEDNSPISKREALRFIFELYGIKNEDIYVMDWYDEEKLEPLNGIPKEDKALILGLYSNYGLDILTLEDILNLDLDAPLTTFDALLYAVRMVGDTYGCTDEPIELMYTTWGETYYTAAEKGLIEDASKEKAGEAISRSDFYKLMCKTICTKYSSGGYTTVQTRMIYNVPDYVSEDEVTVEEKEIDVEVTIKDDMSLSWELPEYIDKDFSFSVDIIYESGEQKRFSTSAEAAEEYSAEDIIELVKWTYPWEIASLRFSYYKTGKSVRYYFDVDVSIDKTDAEGEAPVFGIYAH